MSAGMPPPSTTANAPPSRPRPPPLFLQHSNSSDDAASPSRPLRSPSRSPRPFHSPPVSPRHITPSNPRYRRPTPPLADSTRELELFATQCHAWYYDQNADAGRLVSQTMSTVPDTQRAPFIKLQASIRSAYHADVNARRHAELKAHLSSISPGGSLTPLARADPRGPVAARERHNRLESFVETWCAQSLPGPRPFFEGLWCLMRLQTLPAKIGGAGSHRLEWEIDDALFRETAGKEFMLEAITIMKGVLGFDDAPLLTSDSRVSSCVDLSLQTMASEGESPRQLRPRREPSDPFLDASAQLKDIRDTRRYERATPISAATETGLSRLLPLDDGFDRPEENQMRIWLAPDLSNPEYSSLTSLFPSAIRARTLPRFTTRPSINKSLDLESGTMSEVRSEVRCGTGRMWLSRTERSGRWRGSWWNRFCHWWTTVLSFW